VIVPHHHGNPLIGPLRCDSEISFFGKGEGNTFFAKRDFSRAAVYNARPDNDYSLTDCISMETMRRGGLTEVLTNPFPGT
jgi:hypothetical protein